MTQHQLILEFIKQKGSILPAKMQGYIFMGHMMGSELPRRCRELRKQGKLRSQKEGRFERFFLAEVSYKTFRVLGDDGEVEKLIKMPNGS